MMKEICGFSLDFEKLTEEIAYLFRHRRQCKVFVKVMDITLEDGEEEKFYNLFGPITNRQHFEKQNIMAYRTAADTPFSGHAYTDPSHPQYFECPTPS